MTPSPCWPARPSRGWTRQPGSILRDPELARDAVQDGLVRAWRDCGRSAIPLGSTRGSIDSPSTPVSTSCAAAGVVRSRWRSPRIDGPFGRRHRILIADRDQLDQALKALEPEWRALVVAHYYLGMPLPEAAAALGIPLGTAKSRLHRSLSAMRVAMSIDEADAVAPVPGGQFA